jgi:hypothetical protein
VSNDQLDVDTGFAGHLSCMIYSAFACPYWASKAGKLGKNSAVQPGAPRGTRPAILGHRDIWILMHEDSRPFLGSPEINGANALFGYVELSEDLASGIPQTCSVAMTKLCGRTQRRLISTDLGSIGRDPRKIARGWLR